MQGLPRSGNSSAQTSASLHPPAALRLRCLPFTGHGRPRSVRKSSRLRWKCLSMDCCICSDRRKSLGPSAPIAYATSVSPPDEAVAWTRCGVPANHLRRPEPSPVPGAGRTTKKDDQYLLVVLFCLACVLSAFTRQAAICNVQERRWRPLPALRHPCPAHQYKKSAALVCLCHRISCQTQISVVEEAD